MKHHKFIRIATMALLAPFAVVTTAKADSWSYPTEQIQRLPYDSGAGTKESPYVIKTAQQLADLSYYVNNGRTYEGSFFILSNDIDLNPGYSFSKDGTFTGGTSPKQWVPIGYTNTGCFKANFDGNGHEIKGMYLDSLTIAKGQYSSYCQMGLFGTTANDTLKNIRLTNSLIDLKYKSENDLMSIIVGALVGTANQTAVYSCQNDATIKVNCEDNALQNDNTIGGLVGSLTIDWEKPTIITNCHNSGNIQTNFDHVTVAGLFGNVNGSIKMTDCSNSGDINSTPQGNYISTYTGGLIGTIYGGSRSILENLVNTGEVKGKGSVAGIMVSGNGYIDYAKNCVKNGNISTTAANDFSGGLFGQILCTDIIDCHNEGNVYGGSGIVEYTYASRIIGTYNTGDITGGSGLVGDAPYLTEAKRLYNKGNIYIQTDNDGKPVYNALGNAGLIGTITAMDDKKGLVMEDCYNEGDVEGCAGVIGYVTNDTVTLKRCHNIGNINKTIHDYTPEFATFGYNYKSYDVAGLIIGSRYITTIDSCYNNGTVNGKNRASGIIGRCTTFYIKNSYNTGNVSAPKSAYGITSSAVSNMQNCYNEGNIESDEIAAGIANNIGFVEDEESLMNNVYNAGNVTSGQSVSGIFYEMQYMPYHRTINNVFNYGKLTSTGGTSEKSINPLFGLYNPVACPVFTNCFNLKQQGVESLKGFSTDVTEEDFASGRICVLLNGEQTPTPWGQDLDTDAYPRLNGKGNPDINGISSVRTDASSYKGGCYDLYGRKVNNKTISNDIYVINGKKVAF